MQLNKHFLKYVGAYVSTAAATTTPKFGGRIPGNLNWIEAKAFPSYESIPSTFAMLRFRTSDLDALLEEFDELDPVRRNGQGRRTVVVAYEGVPVRIEEALPAAHTIGRGYSYHSFWIPRTEPDDRDIRLDDAKMYVNNRPNPFGIGWVRYDSDAPYDKIIRSLPHIALSVDNVDDAVDGHRILIPPKQTQPGLRIAFVKCGGFPVEFIEIDPVILPNGV